LGEVRSERETSRDRAIETMSMSVPPADARSALTAAEEAASAGSERQPLETRTHLIWLGDDGIARVKMKPSAEVDAEDSTRAIECMRALRARLPTLVYMAEMKFVSREARTNFAGEEAATLISAAALLTSSPLSRAIGNFFVGLSKPLFPTRLFTSEAEALAWLRRFLP
jgi:hypothetical protein